ncbi:hypothetical protein KK062_10545 [Fulvivirgaceae bacterium PWU5]|uniref:Uncharacterized protein n=1 Tax=Dawidia cretensis TaxID=2782350 RepID=A0AAP2DW25_9BACT|nr:hypothetical protein [Dawidia cretensis]MBT1708665.1 hypothetical protein [Dawidia cretensis]
MNIVCIFEDRLYAFNYRDDSDGADEFERLFDACQDPEFLEQFFEANKNDLQSGFFDPIPTVEQAILITKAEAKRLEKLLRDVVQHQHQPLHNVFRPLSENEDRWPFPRQKVYGLCYKSWFRIYAIRIAHRYYVTGGAIKLTKAMQDRVHTSRELQKMQRCFSFFEEEGIVDVEGAKELDL